MCVSFEQAKKIFSAYDLPLCEAFYQQLTIYMQELTEANRYMNLTAITEPEKIWNKHFLDSAVLLKKASIPLNGACLDVGTGAGFPGMVLAILRPDLQITLLDSLKKRVDFLQRVTSLLQIENVCCVHERAEDAAKNEAYREQYDFVTARAVAALPMLTEYCMPFVKIGGTFAAMKGPNEDAACMCHALSVLGGEMLSAEKYQLAGIGERQLILSRKTQISPPQYPRRSDKMKKNPL